MASLVLPQPLHWGLDHVFWAYVRLFISDLLELKPYSLRRESFFYNNHPVCRVEIIGDIVGIERFAKSTLYTIDDGTAVISCVKWNSLMNDVTAASAANVAMEFELGMTVLIIGKLNEYESKHHGVEMQVNVSRITPCIDVNAETLRWLDIVSLTRTVYDVPFVIPQDSQMIHKRPIDEDVCDLDIPITAFDVGCTNGGIEASLACLILDVISKDQRKCHSFDSLCSIVSASTQAHSLQRFHDNHSRYAVNMKSLISDAMNVLVVNGYLYRKHDDTMDGVEYFEVLARKDLNEKLLKVVSQCSSDKLVGAPVNDILLQFGKIYPSLSSISEVVIRKCLTDMVTGSDLFDAEENCFLVSDQWLSTKP